MFHNKTHNKFNSFLDTQAAFQPFQPPEPEPEAFAPESHYAEPLLTVTPEPEERKYFPGERLLKKLAKKQEQQREKRQESPKRYIAMIEKSLQSLLNEF
jgi:hypothetical protein